MFNPLQYIGCTALPIVTNSYQLKQDFVHSQYLYLNQTFLSHVAKIHFSSMFHLGDDCRKMTPSTYRKNTTFTIPLLRILRVLSHVLYITDGNIGSAAGFFSPTKGCYQHVHGSTCASIKEHIRICLAIYIFCGLMFISQRSFKIFKLQHLQPHFPRILR